MNWRDVEGKILLGLTAGGFVLCLFIAIQSFRLPMAVAPAPGEKARRKIVMPPMPAAPAQRINTNEIAAQSATAPASGAPTGAVAGLVFDYAVTNLIPGLWIYVFRSADVATLITERDGLAAFYVAGATWPAEFRTVATSNAHSMTWATKTNR